MQRVFQLTREAYEVALQRDCSQPCERIDARAGSGIDAEHDAMLQKYTLCDVCGMTGGNADFSHGGMVVCGCCMGNDQANLACVSCIPREVWTWLQTDPRNRHWRCKCCRYLSVSCLDLVHVQVQLGPLCVQPPVHSGCNMGISPSSIHTASTILCLLLFTRHTSLDYLWESWQCNSTILGQIACNMMLLTDGLFCINYGLLKAPL